MPTDTLRRMAARTLVLCAALLLFTSCRGDAPVFRIAYMICNSPEETRERFEPLTAYLSKATGARFEAVYLDTQDFEDAFARGEFEFTHTNSLLYVALAKRHGLKLIAAEKRGAYGAFTKGVVIVRADSPARTLEDLKGKRLMFGPQWAPFGFLAQYALLLEKGLDPETALGPYAFPSGTWKHEKIIYAVLYGAYDAGAAPLIDLEEMTAEGKVAPGDFRVLASSELAPYCTFGAAKTVAPEWIEKVRAALLAADDKTTAEDGNERLSILRRAEVSGFEALSDGAYDPIRRWAKAAKMPPYEEM